MTCGYRWRCTTYCTTLSRASRILPEAHGANNHRKYIKNRYIGYKLRRMEKLVNHALAERQGFEPWVPARTHLISSQAHSAALAPLRTAKVQQTQSLTQPPKFLRAFSPNLSRKPSKDGHLLALLCSFNQKSRRPQRGLTPLSPLLRLSHCRS